LSAAKPRVMDATIAANIGSDSPWWRDSGLRRLVFWQTCILISQMVVGYDEVIVGSFQSMDPWVQGKQNPAGFRPC
jgi:hypothetical protein